MDGQYITDVKHFVTHDDVTWRESLTGSSLLLAVGLLTITLGLAVWWRHRSA
jgi:hypothetical protein